MTRTIEAYWCLCGGNFGDMLTRHWIEKLTDAKVEWAQPSEADLFGCGSIIGPVPENFAGHILGAGMMFAHESRHDLKGAAIRALRGPLTAERIGVDVPFGDMGLLFCLHKPDGIEKEYEIGDLPHYAVKGETPPSHHRIDIRAGIEAVVEEVLKCDKLVSSSLHGVILADALGIENQWIDDPAVFGEGFKFRDYAASLGEEIRPGTWRLGDQERVAALATNLQRIVIETVNARPK